MTNYVHGYECSIRFFKETRVAIVVDDFSIVNYQTCSDDLFYTTAEMQGTVFSLKGFEDFIYSGEFKAMQDQVQHPYYLIVRFIDFYEAYDGHIYCDNLPLEREDVKINVAKPKKKRR